MLTCWVNLCSWGLTGAGRPSDNFPSRAIIVTSRHHPPLNLWGEQGPNNGHVLLDDALVTSSWREAFDWNKTPNFTSGIPRHIWDLERIKGNVASSSSSKCVTGWIQKYLKSPTSSPLQIRFCQDIFNVNLSFVREPCWGFWTLCFTQLFLLGAFSNTTTRKPWSFCLSVAGGKLLVCDFWCCGVVFFNRGYPG